MFPPLVELREDANGTALIGKRFYVGIFANNLVVKVDLLFVS